jgi:hypothetical protein
MYLLLASRAIYYVKKSFFGWEDPKKGIFLHKLTRMECVIAH